MDVITTQELRLLRVRRLGGDSGFSGWDSYEVEIEACSGVGPFRSTVVPKAGS